MVNFAQCSVSFSQFPNQGGAREGLKDCDGLLGFLIHGIPTGRAGA